MRDKARKLYVPLFSSFNLFTLVMCTPPPYFLNLNHLNTAFCGAPKCTLRKVDYKHQESYEMFCWRIMEWISWSDRVRNEEVLATVKGERNALDTVTWRKDYRTGHTLRWNCLLKHVIEGKIEGKIEVMGRAGRRRKLLLDDLTEKRGYWKLKEKALDHTYWRTDFGRSYEPVVRQAKERTRLIPMK